ncbi:MAG: HEAT repeat domain-containing protein [bacterium]
MAQKSFKTDVSFLEKLAIGAVGTQRVIEDLKEQGHKPIELERGSTGFKIWKSIKIKRVRVPDILCLNSGQRIESRAKTRLLISMSHSSADATRGWDYGLKDDDYTALVVCEKTGDNPIDWTADNLVQYIQVRDLRRAFKNNHVIQEKPKGAEEGFESRVTWPAAVASSAGKLISVEKERLQYRRTHDNRTITLSLSKKGIKLNPLVNLNQTFEKNTILASVVNVQNRIEPSISVDVQHYLDLLNSTSISDRYSAAKALSFLEQPQDFSALQLRLNDENEHIYVRLEAAATFARYGQQQGYDFIREVLNSEYLEHRLEAVIILGEIATNESCSILQAVLKDASQHPEIRGGAAWSLGEIRNQNSITDLVDSFQEMDLTIRVEAARALAKLCESYTDEILDHFESSSETERPGIAWALAHSDKWTLDSLLRKLQSDSLDQRQWTAYIFGTNDQTRIINKIETLKQTDPEIYFAVTVLWKLMSSWVFELKEY